MLALATTSAFADDKKPMPMPAKKDAPVLPAGLLQAIAACEAKAQACAAHCQVELGNGDAMFAHCAAAVSDMIVVASATYSLVVRHSPNAKKMAEMCVAACKECSAACAEHKAHWAHNMHLECKECMEACDACAKACVAFTAA
jgi:Cys-rich four helix bundle protein (predicted Tat secretion target)